MPCCPIPSCCPCPCMNACGGCPCPSPCGCPCPCPSPCRCPCPCPCPLRPLSCCPCASSGRNGTSCPSYWPPMSYTPPTQKIFVVVNNYMTKQGPPCSPGCDCAAPQSDAHSKSDCCQDLRMNPARGCSDYHGMNKQENRC